MQCLSQVKNEREMIEAYANIFDIELKNSFNICGNAIYLELKNKRKIILEVRKIV